MRQPLTRVDLVVGTLVTWRVSHLLAEEDGPGRVLARARTAVNATPMNGLLDCFGCVSVWVGALTSLAVRGRRAGPVGLVLGGLAMSGAAFALQKLVARWEPEGWLPEPEVDSPLVSVQRYQEPSEETLARPAHPPLR